MLSLEEIRERLKDRNMAEVARKTGISHITVWKLRSGAQDNFSYATIKALSDYFGEWP